jgi:hypothetical protein
LSFRFLSPFLSDAQIRLSGLREKFFGEMLMNASATWQHEQTTAHAVPSGTESGSAGKKSLLGGYTHIVRSGFERCSPFLRVA